MDEHIIGASKDIRKAKSACAIKAFDPRGHHRQGADFLGTKPLKVGKSGAGAAIIADRQNLDRLRAFGRPTD